MVDSQPREVPQRRSQAQPPVVAAVLALACGLCGLIGWLTAGSVGSLWAFFAAYAAGSAVPTLGAIEALRDRQISVDLLMIAAAIGAAIIGDWIEGAILLFLFSSSGTLEAYATYRTTRSIEALAALRPRETTLVQDGVDVRVAVDDLSIGAVVRVRPGERFPVDGRVLEGETWADEATITGESTPVHKVPGALVFAGTMNGRGSVLVRMTRAVADTTIERIIRMVHEAQEEKAPTQRLVESWQRPYVLSVFAGAAFTFALSFTLHDRQFHDAFYHAMVLLVAASPCAVVAASPSVMLSALARAAFNGVLFKGSLHLENLANVAMIAFDKTGTVTVGKPEVTDVWTASGVDPAQLLALAAAVERHSEHHLAAAILAKASGTDVGQAVEFESHTGLGVHAHVDGLWVGVGREQLFSSHGVQLPEPVFDAARRFRDRGQTALVVGTHNGGPAGVIAVADHPRPEAADAIAVLRRLGIERVVLMTGDHADAARSIGNAIGADEILAGLLPDQKVRELRRLSEGGAELAMVGDGVNDAPALAAAQVGIAMGGAGTDVALEVADVVLMRDDLKKLPFAVWLSRRAQRRVRQNVRFAMGVIGMLVLSSFLGLPLWLGVIGHEGSTLLVVLNGLGIFWESRPPFLVAETPPLTAA